MSELTLMRSHEGDKASEPELNKLLKMSEFPMWPIGKQISMADCRDTIEFVSVAKDLFAGTNMPLIQYLSLVQELLRQTDATEVSRTALNNIRSTKQLWQDFTDVKDYNILVIDNLRRTPIDYLLEKWLNDFYDTRMNVEVRAARLRHTMFELEKRYKGTEREAINWLLLKASRYQVLVMSGLQAETDKIIKAQTKPDGSSRHLSDISEKVFHELTEDMIRQSTITQANRKREAKRAKNALAYEPLVTRPRLEILQGGPPRGGGATSCGGAPRGGGPPGEQVRGRPIGQATDTPAPRGPRPCPHCGANPSPHAFSKCPNKVNSNRLKAEARAAQQNQTVHVDQLAITNGNKVKEIEMDEEL
ncbi:hypothetical protein SARC_03527 [Sphaeroforma arctica JP610]|uniref:Uncharacterized protein n=1 Tax=Sphaeroforma arctica JP610 TaxID=667725 RepID=A0A0L0G5Y5_9EUKA|nr:hypothetical protein SARC_03527 [Sphaeroforma arctica JP610]KNC84256.1 hypothetical protein SARC_03527 [Sphaeroforma arctica JP610]|eukprot:XP_014158158.1 hypothetical protein SARC_03527 [Sphaeroforma arctica JP610]